MSSVPLTAEIAETATSNGPATAKTPLSADGMVLAQLKSALPFISLSQAVKIFVSLFSYLVERDVVI